MKKIMKSLRALQYKGLAIFSALLLLTGATSIFASTAHAAYTYTVTLFAGAQGTFNSNAFNNVLVDSQNIAANLGALGVTVDIQADEVKISGIPAYDTNGKPYRVVYNPSMVNVTNSKYLVRGLRESGKDNDVIGKASFDVSRDMDLVVGYYIASGVVAYTINYVDENNQPIFTVLADGSSVSTETHYGNAGEKVVLAFPYIEGYQPRAYNGVLTLDKDASKNVFNFPYTRIVVEESTTESTSASSSASEGSSSSSESSSEGGGESSSEGESSSAGGNENESGSGNENESGSGNENESGSGNENESGSGNENESGSGNENESGSGNENESGNESGSPEESGSESEGTGEEGTSSIEETMEFSSSEGPAGSTEFPESESETGSDTPGQRFLNLLKKPIFIFGALGGVSGLALLIVLLTKFRKKP